MEKPPIDSKRPDTTSVDATQDTGREAAEKKIFDQLYKSVKKMMADAGMYNLVVEQSGDNELTIKFPQSKSTMLPEDLLKLSVSDHMLRWSYNNPESMGHEEGYLPYRTPRSTVHSLFSEPSNFAAKHLADLYKDLKVAMESN